MTAHKYRAKPTTVDGIRFASKAEARRYGQLRLLERAGKIVGLKLQPRFVLQEAFSRDCKLVQAITYTADFQYVEKGKVMVEDVKGFSTAVFRIKWRLFLKRYPDIHARIVEM